MPFPGQSDQTEWWSRGRFKTKPAWYIGQPYLGVVDVQMDVMTAEDWAWLIGQVRKLRWRYETRTGRALADDRWLS